MNRKLYRIILSIIIPLIYSLNAISQPLEYTFSLSEMFPLSDFRLVKDDAYKIQALNKDGNIEESISGIYTVVINGYIENINFKKGEATLSKNFETSEIFYIKHERSSNTIRHLFYSFSNWVIPIPFWLLLVIPLLFLVLAMFIKRILFLILIIGFVLFFILQGMDLSSFISLLKESISSLI